MALTVAQAQAECRTAEEELNAGLPAWADGWYFGGPDNEETDG